MSIRDFIKRNYRHFNSAVVLDASEAWVKHLKSGNKMFLSMAGAMSTGEIGLSLAEMIRKDKVHGMCTTAANLEEDLFNLVAHSHYKRIPNYRELSPQEELDLRNKHLNRVTDTCIPEEEAIRRLAKKIYPLWEEADKKGKKFFPYEYFYQAIKSGALKEFYEIDPKDSWVIAACEKNIPVFTPGWEDSTLANGVVAEYKAGRFKNLDFIKSGLEQMDFLIDWYLENTKNTSIGFFQIGGGIAGDFPICVVPLIRQDMSKDCKVWGYFCQISDSTTSYGSYSGAVPNEKITWEKLGVDTPRFIIESDASIVAPLVFQYVLESV
ncbi:MAG: deoxyhypusine synthase family protein [Candidatus Omnitrophica bacterium]|nr:deoxyhypusine synthase family protein [Candidatus Omnitrophota bacterium]